MSLTCVGVKKGMICFFTEKKEMIPCSVLFMEPNVVVQKKQIEKDGYDALQLGAISPKKVKNIKKPIVGHFKKAKVELKRCLVESRTKEVDQYRVGDMIGVDYFSKVSHLDIRGLCRGKGFQGVMKRHGFKGGPASHGSGFHRKGGSSGMCSSPGRCLPKVKKAGQMGGNWVMIQSLKVISIDGKNHLIIVKGAVPGAIGSIVYIKGAIKRTTTQRRNIQF